MQILEHVGRVYALAWHPTDGDLLTAGQDGACLWDMEARLFLCIHAVRRGHGDGEYTPP
jgi:WD40 repeat protein